MVTTLSNLKLGLVQMASGAVVEDNLERIQRLLSPLRGACDVALLPEYCLALGGRETVRRAARTAGAWQRLLAPVVAWFGAPIVFGGVPVRNGNDEITNSTLVMSRVGKWLARYDKIHLFQLRMHDANELNETATFTPGKQVVAFNLNGWKIGLSICYDLRFPELYRACAPVDLQLCPAAFTAFTGAAHWHVLLRARAIENQCFMAAPGQCGTDPDSAIDYYGHSLIADPWGVIITEAESAREQSLLADLAPARLATVRQRLPALRDFLEG